MHRAIVLRRHASTPSAVRRGASAHCTGLAPSSRVSTARLDADEVAAPAAVDADARQREHARLDVHRHRACACRTATCRRRGSRCALGVGRLARLDRLGADLRAPGSRVTTLRSPCIRTMQRLAALGPPSPASSRPRARARRAGAPTRPCRRARRTRRRMLGERRRRARAAGGSPASRRRAPASSCGAAVRASPSARGIDGGAGGGERRARVVARADGTGAGGGRGDLAQRAAACAHRPR